MTADGLIHLGIALILVIVVHGGGGRPRGVVASVVGDRVTEAKQYNTLLLQSRAKEAIYMQEFLDGTKVSTGEKLVMTLLDIVVEKFDLVQQQA